MKFLCLFYSSASHCLPVLHSCQDNEGASNSAEEDGEGEELDEEEEEGGIPHLLYNNSEDSDPGGI